MIREAIEKLARGAEGDEPHLTESESEAVAMEIMTGEATAAQVAAFLTALRCRGEQVDQVVGFIRAMRKHMTPFPKSGKQAVLLDTCGTGGDRLGTFNISTAAAFLVAAAGIPVAKHGNRSVSSRCGSSDVLGALGIDLTPDPAVAARCLDEVGLCFLFAPQYHPAMKHAAVPRREIGIRTIFNVCGPLANPAFPTHQLIGVPDTRLLDLVAQALARLGIRSALVVHGDDALDEISPAAPSKALRVNADGSIVPVDLDPAAVGIAPCAAGDLVGGDAAANAAILETEVLAGKPGPRTDAAALNAAAALWIAGAAEDLAEALEKIRGVLAEKKALDTLAALRRLAPPSA